MIENVSAELKKYFEGKSMFSSLLGIGSYILYGAAALSLLNCIVSLGGFVSAIITYVFILGVLLCLANLDFNALMIGFGAAALGELILLFRGFFSEDGAFLSWDALFAVIIYGYFAYASYMKTLKKA